MTRLLSFGCAVIVAVGCGGGSRQSRGATASTQRHPASTTTALPRCVAAGTSQRSTSTAGVEKSISVGNSTRTFLMAMPSEMHGPAPVLIDFHGFPSDARSADAETGLSRRGTEAGYVVITPVGLGGGWNLHGTATTDPDIIFISRLLRSFDHNDCVASSRVYVTGKSQGAAFSIIVACAIPTVTAVAVVAVEYPFAPCDRSFPIVAFHGTADPLVPYGGGRIYSDRAGEHDPGTMADMQQWASRDRCATVPTSTTLSSETTRRQWTRCVPRSDVVLYTVNGGGHTWPGRSIPGAQPGKTTTQLDATATILQFFNQHAG